MIMDFMKIQPKGTESNNFKCQTLQLLHLNAILDISFASDMQYRKATWLKNTQQIFPMLFRFVFLSKNAFQENAQPENSFPILTKIHHNQQFTQMRTWGFLP